MKFVTKSQTKKTRRAGPSGQSALPAEFYSGEALATSRGLFRGKTNVSPILRREIPSFPYKPPAEAGGQGVRGLEMSEPPETHKHLRRLSGRQNAVPALDFERGLISNRTSRRQPAELLAGRNELLRERCVRGG